MAQATVIPVTQAAGDSGDLAAPATGVLFALATADGKCHPFMSASVFVKTLNGQYTYAFGLNGSEPVRHFTTLAAVTIKVTKDGNAGIAAFGVDMIS